MHSGTFWQLIFTTGIGVKTGSAPISQRVRHPFQLPMEHNNISLSRAHICSVDFPHHGLVFSQITVRCVRFQPATLSSRLISVSINTHQFRPQPSCSASAPPGCPLKAPLEPNGQMPRLHQTGHWSPHPTHTLPPATAVPSPSSLLPAALMRRDDLIISTDA